MKHTFLTAGILVASSFAAHADEWTTTEPNGSRTRTTVKSPNQAARDYSRGNSNSRFNPSQTTTITRGARIPDNVNSQRPREDNDRPQSRLQVGTYVPYYPYYPAPYYPAPYYGYPYYPAPVYTYPPQYTPLTPHAGIVTSGGTIVGYPYGYVPAPSYYPYVETPQWNFYGYDGPAYGGNGGSYQSETNTTHGGISIGRDGPRVSVGGTRTTTSGSYSTFP